MRYQVNAVKYGELDEKLGRFLDAEDRLNEIHAGGAAIVAIAPVVIFKRIPPAMGIDGKTIMHPGGQSQTQMLAVITVHED